MCTVRIILGKLPYQIRIQVPVNKDSMDCNDCEWRLLANLIVMVMTMVMVMAMVTDQVMNMMVVVDARR